jgi:hypothetical protein
MNRFGENPGGGSDADADDGYHSSEPVKPDVLNRRRRPTKDYPPQKEPEEVEVIDDQPLNPGKIGETDPTNPNKTLNERYPKLKEVIIELHRLKRTEFDDHQAEFNSPYLIKLNELAEKMKEALLLKAIVQCWNKTTLFTEFKKRMVMLRDVASKESMPKEGWVWLGMQVKDVITGDAEGIPGIASNPHLADRMNARNILNIRAELSKIDQAYVEIEPVEFSDAVTGDPLLYGASLVFGPEQLLAQFDGDYPDYIDICLVMGANGKCNTDEDLDDMTPAYRQYFREVILPIERPFWIDYYTNLGVVGDFTMNEIKDAYTKRMNLAMQGP